MEEKGPFILQECSLDDEPESWRFLTIVGNLGTRASAKIFDNRKEAADEAAELSERRIFVQVVPAPDFVSEVVV